MIINVKNNKFVYKILIIFCIIFVILLIYYIITLLNNASEEDTEREQARIQEEYLLSQMLPIENKYSITGRNSQEIILQHYTLGYVNIYDKLGTSVVAFNIENMSIYYNWYTIEQDNNGLFDINLITVDRPEDKSTYFNNELYIIHDRALQINLSPYTDLNFASVNGENKSRNKAYEFENSSQIKYEVKTNVTEFETTKILNIVDEGWNTSHTLQFYSYEISLIKIIFEDTTYKKAGIAEYRFTAFGTYNEDLFSIYNMLD